MPRIAIIGGTGLSQVQDMKIVKRRVVSTPWGEPSAPVITGSLNGREAVFLPRHGTGHTIPPHEVNYRANLWALRELEVDFVVAVNAVGGITEPYPPGRIAVPHQVIDYTWGRPHTFFEGRASAVTHVDFTRPYDDGLRERLVTAGKAAGIDVYDGGVYGATQGPRLETAAEIDRMARDGCDMVGMTGMPEAALARELNMAYASCAISVNWAAGRGDGGDIHGEIAETLDAGMAQVRRLVGSLLSLA